MIIDTVKKLINSDLSAYHIHQATGVSASSIQRLRSGERQVEKLSLESAEKLYLYQKQREQENN